MKALAIALVLLFTISWFGSTGYRIAIVGAIILGISYFLKGVGTRGLAL